MSTIFAPAQLMAIHAIAAEKYDPDLAEGVHVRIFAGSKASFPVTPFIAVNMKLREDIVSLPIIPRDDEAKRLGYAEHAIFNPQLAGRIIVYVELLAPPDRIKRVELIDYKGRVVSARDNPPWRFSANNMNRLRIYGRIEEPRFQIGSTSEGDVLHNFADGTNSEILSLPVEKTHCWYVGTQDRDIGFKRVAVAAPKRTTPIEQPEGPLDNATPEMEVARIEALLNAQSANSTIEKNLWEIVSNKEQPWLQTTSETFNTEIPGNNGQTVLQTARTPRLNYLQLSAIDPGLARFLGFSALLQNTPTASDSAIAVFCMIAFDTTALQAEFSNIGIADPALPGPNDAVLRNIIENALDPNARGQVASDIDTVVSHSSSIGVTVRPFVAIISPAPPPTPPELTQPYIKENQWESVDQHSVSDARPSATHRATFAFTNPPVATLLAIARLEDGSWLSRHEPVGGDPRAGLSRRFLSQKSETSEFDVSLGVAIGAILPTALVSDQFIQAKPMAVTSTAFRFWISDVFGRFGNPCEFTLEPSERPKPPKPVLNYELELTSDMPNDEIDRSAGKLKISIRPSGDAITSEEFGNGIIVPQLKELSAGSLPITVFNLTWDGASVPQVSLPVDWNTNPIEIMLELPKLAPQAQREVLLTGTFVDASGVESQTAQISVKLADPRPPIIVPTGQSLYWTSAPGTTGEVELRLRWPAAKNTTYRAFLTDARSLVAKSNAVNIEGLSRSETAVAICSSPSIGNDRSLFRKLPETAISFSGDFAELSTTLPGSLDSVQFLRIVPVNSNAVEAIFENCGLTPIAVPSSQRPPSPELTGRVDGITGQLALTLLTNNLAIDILRKEEPGLFDNSKPGKEPPKYRVRMATSAKDNPIYARSFKDDRLKLDQGAFIPEDVSKLSGIQLSPFVRYSFWAEIQLPPERNIPAGVSPLTPVGGIEPISENGKKSHARPVSNTSPALPVIWLKSEPPAPLRLDQVTLVSKDLGAAKPSLVLKMSDVPSLHPRAIGPYRLASWFKWSGGNLSSGFMPSVLTAVEKNHPVLISGEAITIELRPPSDIATNALQLKLAVVDPTGKFSDLTTFDVP